MDLNPRPTKHPRRAAVAASSSKVLENDGLLQSIVSFLPHSFRYTAAVNKQFYRNYLMAHQNSHQTSYEIAVQKVEMAKIWLTDSANDPHTEKLEIFLANAAFHGRLSVLVFLHSEGFHSSDETICANAAKGGHLEVLKWAREHGCEWDDHICYTAAANGHLEVLQWAMGHGCDWHKCTSQGAAYGGHLEVLQWAREHGCEWHWLTCQSAAINGHLEVLQWAREHGCDWDENTCWAAAYNGHLQVLRWASEHGCPWDAERCARVAEQRGFLDVRDWVREHQ